LPTCPEIKVVMTADLGKDPKEWSEAGHLTTKGQRDAIKKRMIDSDDPLKMVIVCDMWLTGTDIPCLHTLYIDKPMRGHSMIQAISRVNRVFLWCRSAGFPRWFFRRALVSPEPGLSMSFKEPSPSSLSLLKRNLHSYT
jgi:type I site-specific restriction-modification system R (restriction) subunit